LGSVLQAAQIEETVIINTNGSVALIAVPNTMLSMVFHKVGWKTCDKRGGGEELEVRFIDFVGLAMWRQGSRWV